VIKTQTSSKILLAMAADERIDLPPPFRWGGYVRLSSRATKWYAIAEGSVCGVRRVENGPTAAKFGTQIGSLLLLVEGGCGNAIEIPIELLEVG
jgi:hypothetical protein